MSVGSILVFVTSDADNALGENVLKLPLLLALSAAFPTARIAWVPGMSGAFYLRESLAPLVGGRIDEFITDLAIPTDPRAALFAKHPILDRHFDLIVDAQRCFGRTLFLRRIPHRRLISGTWRYVLSTARPAAATAASRRQAVGTGSGGGRTPDRGAEPGAAAAGVAGPRGRAVAGG